VPLKMARQITGSARLGRAMGKGPIMTAYHGHPEAARALLPVGANPELANDRGQTPLAAAAFKGVCLSCTCCSIEVQQLMAAPMVAGPAAATSGQS
jgi:hypothetical protein